VPQHLEKSIDELVREVRSLYRSKIQYDCDKIQFLNRQVPIDNLYTKVYILEDIPKLRSLDISERMQGFDPTADDPNSFYLGKVRGERIPGLDVVTDGCKLMCLGAPGSGKTTYLSYVAIQCNKEKLQANRVPIFIKLFSFAEKVAEKLTEQFQWSLFDYIEDLLGIQGIQQVDVKSILLEGRGLILLDGLDEVPKNIEKLNIFYDLPKKFDLSKLILRRIREFCETYHKNSIIITCRTNALEYNFSNLGFTQVIVSDFEDEQIKIFAEKWFVAAAKNNHQAGKAKANQFIEELNLSKNKRIRDLVVTPILLNLTCLVFNKNDDFPSNRSELYRQALDILLKEWDISKQIPRDEVYGNLDLEGKKALLSHVAKVTFDENRYFLKQEEIKKYIAAYLQTLPNAQTCRLQQDSEAVLKSIEAQHGLFIERADEIYSFSHLTFQEYFTAKWFCDRDDWPDLVSHLNERQWREVFLLAVGMTKSADELLCLMKKNIDAILAKDQILQEFMQWANQKKSIELKVSYKPAAIRAFYFTLDLLPTQLSRYIERNLAPAIDDKVDFAFHVPLPPDLTLDRDLIYLLELALEGDDAMISRVKMDILNSTYSFAHEETLAQNLQQLREELSFARQADLDKCWQWWQANGQDWTTRLRKVMVDHREIGRDWQFTEQHLALLNQYYDANKLLVDCLNSGYVVTDEVREEIEKTLLLPIAEIEKRQQQI
jgi:predicted NACHT family NTPase